MTKEQIEQKAKNVYMRCFDDDFEYTGVLHALEICVEETATETTKELQKQIEIDAKQIRALQKQNGELTDKVNDLEEKLANADYQLEGRDLEIKELESQIEQMKCCFNCKHSRTVYEHCRTDKREKWERKEK